MVGTWSSQRPSACTRSRSTWAARHAALEHVVHQVVQAGHVAVPVERRGVQDAPAQRLRPARAQADELPGQAVLAAVRVAGGAGQLAAGGGVEHLVAQVGLALGGQHDRVDPLGEDLQRRRLAALHQDVAPLVVDHGDDLAVGRPVFDRIAHPVVGRRGGHGPRGRRRAARLARLFRRGRHGGRHVVEDQLLVAEVAGGHHGQLLAVGRDRHVDRHHGVQQGAGACAGPRRWCPARTAVTVDSTTPAQDSAAVGAGRGADLAVHAALVQHHRGLAGAGQQPPGDRRVGQPVAVVAPGMPGIIDPAGPRPPNCC